MSPVSETKSQVALLESRHFSALRTFLQKHPQTTIFQTPEWNQLIEATYGHQTHYWVVREGEEITGVFPVVAVRYPLLGLKMVAMPYQFHSGLPVANSEQLARELIHQAVQRAKESRAKFLEIRHFEAVPWLEEMGFVKVESHLVTSSCPLANLDLPQIRRNHRRNIRYAAEKGVVISEGNSLSDLRMFQRMYLIEGRQLGSPQAGWNYFENHYHIVRPYYRLFLAWVSGVCLGGLLSIDDGRTVFSRCAAFSSPEALALHVGRALYWKALTDAAERGCTSFNLGISWDQDKGLIHDKEGWNATTRAVYLYIYPIRSQPPSPGGYFGGFQLAKATWRRLPLPIVDWAGRQVTRWIC